MKLLILGAGGLGTEYLWVAQEMNQKARRNGRSDSLWEILGYADDDPTKKDQLIFGHLVHGNIQETFAKYGSHDVGFAAAIGRNDVRERIAQDAEQIGWTPVTLAHPSAIIAEQTAIGAGTYLAPGTVVCPGAIIGRHVIVNTHASIGHDSVLEDLVQICPGARVNGGCRVEKSGFLGSNASLAPGVTVGQSAVVGANSVAVRKVSRGVTVLGCPAIPIRPNPR